MRDSSKWIVRRERASDRAMKYGILINGVRRSVEFTPFPDESSRIAVVIDGRTVEADAVKISTGVYSILLDGRSLEVTVEETAEGLRVCAADCEFRVEIADSSWRSKRGGGIELEGRQPVSAPMPGKIVSVLITSGQNVEAGRELFVIEAMKMQNGIRSPKSGSVERLLVKEGQTVNAGEILAIIM
jgi:biotin carboxyl carrier protein